MERTIEIFTGEVFSGSDDEIIEKIRSTSRTPGEDVYEFMELYRERSNVLGEIVDCSSTKAFIESNIKAGLFHEITIY